MQLEIKRLYIPFKHKIPCPKCNSMLLMDMETHPLNYPKLGEPIPFYVYCKNCDEAFAIPIQIDFNVKILYNGNNNDSGFTG